MVNINQKKTYSTPESLIDAILDNAPNTPILFVAGNYDDFEIAKKQIIKDYKVEKIQAKHEIIGVGKGEQIFDDIYGQRTVLEPEKLKHIFEWHFHTKDN